MVWSFKVNFIHFSDSTKLNHPVAQFLPITIEKEYQYTVCLLLVLYLSVFFGYESIYEIFTDI